MSSMSDEPTEAASSSSTTRWYLEGFLDPAGGVWRTCIEPCPFLVGRRPAAQVRLESALVSGVHAELFERENLLWVRDLGSTNGTFVNSERITGEVRIGDGDLVQFADQEFRIVKYDPVGGFRTTLDVRDEELGPGLLTKLYELGELIRRGGAAVHFQPIVDLEDLSIEGYEVLGRGRLAGRDVSPIELLGLAEGGGLVEELSALFRVQGVEAGRALPRDTSLFVNTHPAEIRNPKRLTSSLRELPRDEGPQGLVLELHEGSVSDVGALREVAAAVRELGVEIAFDDFGTGHDRLVALADVSPRYVKFDVRLIRGLHEASQRRRSMVRRLVQLTDELGIESLAEGIEVTEEAEICRELGFQLAQGFFFGRPAPAERWVDGLTA